jgi:ribosomal protein L32
MAKQRVVVEITCTRCRTSRREERRSEMKLKAPGNTLCRKCRAITPHTIMVVERTKK